MRHRRATQLLVIGVLITGCGGDDDAELTPADPAEASDAAGDEPDADDGAASDGGETSGDPAQGGAAEVAIVDDDGRRFDPAEVAVGETVTWTHEGGLPHTVTAADGAFDSGNLVGGDSFEFTAEEPGTIDYACAIHPEMTGSITVT